MILAEINLCSARVDGFDFAQNNLMMVEHLDFLDECREVTTIWLAEYQQSLAWRYNRDVKTREFSVGDLVLKRVVGNMRDANAGKLVPTWEGPYRVTTIAGAGAYYLECMDELPLPRPWNVHNLKIFLSLINCTRGCGTNVI